MEVLYQGLNNNWLRRIAHGRDVFILPFDNIGTTVFVAERGLGPTGCLPHPPTGHQPATERGWPGKLPNTCNPGSQARLLLILPASNEFWTWKLRLRSPGTTPSGSTPTPPIFQSLHSQTPSPSTFTPSSLLATRGLNPTRFPPSRRPPTRSGLRTFNSRNPSLMFLTATLPRHCPGGLTNLTQLGIQLSAWA